MVHARRRFGSRTWQARACAALVVIVTVLAWPHAAADAQTRITIGKFIGGSSLHIPTYIGVAKGFYKEEGLDATFVTLAGRPLVTAGMSGNADFVPIPSGGAQAALSGAELRFVVGSSLRSHWVILARPGIERIEDLRGKTIAYGRPGGADYDEGAAVLSRVYRMEVGKDYKVISFSGEPERIAAMVAGNIEAALVTVAQVPTAVNAGMKVLLRLGVHLERAAGTIWVRKAYIDRNPDVIPRFIRGTAKAIQYYRDNREGSIPVLKEHLGLSSDKDAGTVWEETKDTFGAEVPKALFHEIFESRRVGMIAESQWPKDKPLPDPEQWLMRDVLERTLKDMGYVPAVAARR